MRPMTIFGCLAKYTNMTTKRFFKSKLEVVTSATDKR